MIVVGSFRLEGTSPGSGVSFTIPLPSQVGLVVRALTPCQHTCSTIGNTSPERDSFGPFRVLLCCRVCDDRRWYEREWPFCDDAPPLPRHYGRRGRCSGCAAHFHPANYLPTRKDKP